MSRSRLPPPPTRGGGGRPLPPEPPRMGGGDDAPPPLPSRPGGRAAPPSFRQPPVPTMNGQSPETSDQEQYEEPDAPPPVTRHAPPKPRQPEPEHEQETYDDLDDRPASSDSEESITEQETYDQCDIKQEQPAYEVDDDEQLYEAEPPMDDTPPSPPPIEEDCTYEFVPEEAMPAPPITSPPHHRQAAPPPSGAAPNLPARPPPSRPSESGDSAPELPDRPAISPGGNKTNIKKMSGGGPQMLGISVGDIGEKKANLRKVASIPDKDFPPGEAKQQVGDDASSVKDRINMFKQVEKDDSDSTPDHGSFLSQIAHARNSLKKRPQDNNQSSNIPSTNTVNVHPSLTQSNMSIQERIAMMAGKSADGLEIKAALKPPVPFKPSTGNKPTPPDKSFKPTAALRTIAQERTNIVRTPSPSQNFHNEAEEDKKKPLKPVIPKPPFKPPKSPLIQKSSDNTAITSVMNSGMHSLVQKPDLNSLSQDRNSDKWQKLGFATPDSLLKQMKPVTAHTVGQLDQQLVGTDQQHFSQMTKPVETKSELPVVTSPTTPPLKPPPAQNYFQDNDDIYDEGMSYVPDPLSREEWYHGEIERNDSNAKLHSIGQDGTFLVRKSQKGGDTQPYTLVVLYEGHVYNLKMRVRKDGQVALGEEKPDELAFKDVPSLIQHHRTHDVILVNVKQNKQHKTLLKKHPIAMNG